MNNQSVYFYGGLSDNLLPLEPHSIAVNLSN